MNGSEITYPEDESDFDYGQSNEETTMGWRELNAGNHNQALEHFKQALIHYPKNELAKRGMLQGLKMRYWFFRIFQNYMLWMEEKSSAAKWGVLIGFYMLNRALLFINNHYPSARIIVIPLIVLYLCFALTTWIMIPLSNLILRLNPYGRFALDEEEVKSSNLLGIDLLLACISGAVYFFTGNMLYAMCGFFFLTMSVPLAGVFLAPAFSRARKLLIAYASGMMVLGVFAIMAYLSGGDEMNRFSGIYILALVIYQWVANALVIR